MGLLEVNSINNTKTVTSTVATSSTASTVTNPLPLVNDTKKDENKGLTIEKTTQKTGESIDERLSRFYTKYKDATPEEKEKFLDKYITQYYSEIKGKSRSEQIQIQLADYKKLIANTKKGDSYEMLAKRINILEKENQVSAAKNLTVEQSNLELRKRGEIGVAKTIQNCDKGNQVELTKLVVDSKNEEAIKIGASHASELDVKNQTPAVQIYQKANISAEAQKVVDHNIIDQYAKFAKENQLDIHQTMSDSKLTETVKYAASNIYHFDKTNQAAAVKITANTGNEAATKAAAEQYAKYDKSVLEEIRSIINSTNCDSAKEALTEAEEAEAVKEAQETSTKEQTISETTDKAATKDLSSKLKEIETSNSISKEAQIKELVKHATPGQLETLLSQQNPSMDLINAALEQNPTSNVLLKIISLTGNMADKEQKELVEKINNVYSANVITSKMSLFSAKTQNIFIKECADKSNLKTINRMFLSASAKSTYDELMKENRMVG